jgi:hypothetical protein
VSPIVTGKVPGLEANERLSVDISKHPVGVKVVDPALAGHGLVTEVPIKAPELIVPGIAVGPVAGE